MKKYIPWTLTVLLVLGNSPLGYALDTDQISTVETISSQSIKGDDVIAPYHITGEALVHMIHKLVDFDVPGSNIIFNRKSAQLFVRNTPTNHDLIEKILTDLRSVEQRQVEIEARIVTVKSTDINDIGLDFLGVDFVTEGGSNTQWGTDFTKGDGSYATNVDFPNVQNGAGDSPFGGQLAFSALTSDLDLDMLIDMLKARAEVNTLSCPRLIVTNNQRANINIEKAEYYVQSLQVDSDTDRVATDPEVGIAQSGTILDVTPSINADGTISLEMHPQFVTVDLSDTETIEISAELDDSEQPSVTLPIFTSQSADTTITIENGGVATIGGLIGEEETKGHYKIPVLGDIPIIGKLCFQSEQVQEVKTHLLIFVKATTRDPKKAFVGTP